MNFLIPNVKNHGSLKWKKYPIPIPVILKAFNWLCKNLEMMQYFQFPANLISLITRHVLDAGKILVSSF